MRKITKRAGVIIGVAALGISGGVAWAVWSITGTATATATAAEAKPVVITAQASGLFPGGTKPLSISSTNPNEFPVAVTGIVGTPLVSTDNEGCPASNVDFLPPAVKSLVLQPGNTTQTVQGAVSMKTEAPDACQGATFKITANITGVSTQN